MIFYLILIFGLLLIPCKAHLSTFNDNYIGLDNCNAIKGFFILIVFISHSFAYLNLLTPMELVSKQLINWIGQLMVAMFLFYSGYGVYFSINKKQGYIDSIPKKRLGITLLHFDIAVISYAILNLILHIPMSKRKLILSFIGWESIGNSNWYIFGILALYLITYIAFKLSQNKKEVGIVLTWIFSLAFVYMMSRYKESYWFDTILCYPFGLTYGYFKQYMEPIFRKNLYYYPLLFASIVLFFIFRKLSSHHYLFFSCEAMMTCVVITLFTMKIQSTNQVLIWCGKNLFWLYILQRIPMMILKQIGFSNPILFVFISFVATIILVFIYDFCTKKIDQMIIK